MILEPARIRRVIKCSAYVISKRNMDILDENTIRGVAPIFADITVSEANYKGETRIFDFLVYHGEYYILTFLFLTLIDFLLKTRNCVKKEGCEINYD